MYSALRSPLFFVLISFLIWRGVTIFAAAAADHVLPYAPSFPHAEGTLKPSGLPRFLYSFGNFDGIHYLTIATNGYQFAYGTQAFFPLFPTFILGTLHDTFGIFTSLLPLGLIVTNLALVLFLLLFYTLAKELFDHTVARGTVIALLSFPTSFFLGALYTESLFLVFVTGSVLAARRSQYPLASLLCILATSSRVVGIFLVPTLLLLLWHQKRPRIISTQTLKDWLQCNIVNIIWIFLGSIGLLWYMQYLFIVFGDPLLFATVQSSFGSGRSTSHLILYPQVLWRSIKILFLTPVNMRYFTSILEFLAGVIPLVAMAKIATSIPFYLTFFSLACFFFPPLTGNFSSMPRYVLVCSSLFLAEGMLWRTRPVLASWLFAVQCVCLIVCTILFVQGYWVA